MLTSRRVNRWLPWISAAVLVAGLITFFAVRNTGEPAPLNNSFSKKAPLNAAVSQKSIPLTQTQRKLAGRFILTAVQRKHLAEAYRLSGPAIREGMTLKQWMTGNIAVAPFLKKIGLVTVHPEYSYKREALLKIIMVPADNTRAYTFYLQLNKFGRGTHAHWLVNGWQPTGRFDIATSDLR
jgi:hypothetical protein